MRRDEFTEVLKLIQRKLEQAGVWEIAQQGTYRTEDGDGAVKNPRDLAVAMLEAFDVHLALLDRSTYKSSIGKIRDLLDSTQVPDGAEITFETSVDTATDDHELKRDEFAAISFSDLSDLSSVRESLRKLTSELSDTPFDESLGPIRQ